MNNEKFRQADQLDFPDPIAQDKIFTKPAGKQTEQAGRIKFLKFCNSGVNRPVCKRKAGKILWEQY